MDNIFGEQVKPVAHYRNTTLTKLDIDRAKAHFSGYKQAIEALEKEVNEFKVNSDNDATELTAKSVKVKKLIDRIEKERKEQIKDPESFVRGLNSFVKTFRDGLNNTIKVAKEKIGQYEYQKELERRKQEEKARQAQAKLQAEMDKEAKAAGVEAPKLPPAVMPEKKEAIRTDSGSAHMQTEWVHELDEFSKVPREYLVLNEKIIKNAIKAGIREIPGLIIKEVPKIQLRKI